MSLSAAPVEASPMPQSEPYSSYFAMMAEGGRIGLCICKRCGATILLGDGEVDSIKIHDRWHDASWELAQHMKGRCKVIPVVGALAPPPKDEAQEIAERAYSVRRETIDRLDREAMLESEIRAYGERQRGTCIHCGDPMGHGDDACWSCYSTERDRADFAEQRAEAAEARAAKMEQAARRLCVAIEAVEYDLGTDYPALSEAWVVLCAALGAPKEGK